MLCFLKKYRFARSGAATVMAIRIKARGGESAEQMLRRFKKLCEKEGLTKDVKKRQYFEKPSERTKYTAAMLPAITKAITTCTIC